ncbi:MAG: S41 family peptidase [Flavobacteriaceae bacterium]|jgi:carboxyl-terminal processing protease|nr:S41 family peptidase [Flavobacteriaceae bacterium]
MKRIKKIAIAALLLLITTAFTALQSDYFEVAKQLEIYTTLFKELNMYYIDETNPAQLTETAIDNMLKDLDPYTQFYDEQGVEKARIDAAGDHGGIGAETQIIDKKLIIVEPYEGLSADKADLKAGDEIIMINDVNVQENAIEDAFFLLDGTPKSTVKLQVKRGSEVFEKVLTREKTDVDPVPYHHMIDDEVGYISFIKFNDMASSRVKEAFEDLKAQGMKKLILDVRGNPGGLLNEAVEITNYFIPKEEVVVTTKAKIKKWSDIYKTKRDPLDLEIPIVVLIDGRSASASEILAGSLQDMDRAVIVGERSFGKGLVQRYRKLTYGTQLKLTISKYYTPSGRCIQELDYTHRDEDGNIPKFSDKKRNPFKTKNGRTVYDGGGIEPDIKLNDIERTEATKSLFNSNAIFNYATDFYYAHKEIASSKDFRFTDADYQDFINALNSGKVNFKTETEKELEKIVQVSEIENFKSGLEKEYSTLSAKIKSEKIKALTVNKNEIIENLTNEIVKRYYYKKGEYIHKVYNDKSILRATEILKDTNKYQNILK